MKYLLDNMMVKEIGKTNPHQNVDAWLSTVNDIDLAISAISVREIWKGIENKRKNDPTVANTIEAAVKIIRSAYQGRILSVDESVATQWGKLLSQSEKNIDDTGIAATAYIHGIVVVTRNAEHFRGRGVDILDPFKAPPQLHKA